MTLNNFPLLSQSRETILTIPWFYKCRMTREKRFESSAALLLPSTACARRSHSLDVIFICCNITTSEVDLVLPLPNCTHYVPSEICMPSDSMAESSPVVTRKAIRSSKNERERSNRWIYHCLRSPHPPLSLPWIHPQSDKQCFKYKKNCKTSSFVI